MGTPAPSAYSKDRPFPARITENRLLSRAGSGKETRHLVVSIAGSGLTYKAGDSLGVQPSSRPEDVGALLGLLRATGEEPVSPAMLKLSAPITLREALTNRLALAGPTTKLVNTLSVKATDPTEKARLAA